jgi:hypothetical protein
MVVHSALVSLVHYLLALVILPCLLKFVFWELWIISCILVDARWRREFRLPFFTLVEPQLDRPCDASLGVSA